MDYRWPSFLSSAPAFVSAVPSPSDLCDLLFALRPGSVLGRGGAYEGLMDMVGEGQGQGQQQGGQGGQGQGQVQGGGEAEAGGEGKVTAVCRAVREAVGGTAEYGGGRYLEVVVTSYAR